MCRRKKRVQEALEEDEAEAKRIAAEETEATFQVKQKKYACAKCGQPGHRATYKGKVTCAQWQQEASQQPRQSSVDS